MSTVLAARRRRLEASRLYLVVTLRDEVAEAWQPTVADVLATGCIGMVQLRDVGGDDRRLLGRGRLLASHCAEHETLFLVNDRPDLAAALDADGAHVGQEDLSTAQSRALLGPDRLLGLSTHDAVEMQAARTAGVDYAGLGPCFPTASKALTRTPSGPALVEACLAAAGSLPFFPIGGITPENVHSLVSAGARRAAVGAGILGERDPADAARRLDAALRGAAA